MDSMEAISQTPSSRNFMEMKSALPKDGFAPLRMQRSSITNSTHRSSCLTNYTSNDNGSFDSAKMGELSRDHPKEALPPLHVLRRSNNDGTAPTMFSVMSRSDKSSNRSLLNKDASVKLSPLFRFMKYGRRRKQLSEVQLRQQIKKHCESREWSRVRKLISRHDFHEGPEEILETANSVAAKSSSSEDRQSSNKEMVHNIASRRPSYGSRNGERLSFSGKESAAAAAVIKAAAAAALLEECSSSENGGDKSVILCEENILHDICAYNPPRDVIELLLAAMRHRRGSTCGRDDKGRTPLHVAAANGASSEVIDALVRADPLPATMGDDDDRSPLHLAVKYLAYDEYVIHTPQSTAKPSMFQFRRTGAEHPGFSIPSRDEVIEETRTTVEILKNTMMTYPGQVDFKDEDKTGFAPIDYAIDGSVMDRYILRWLIRRSKSQNLCRRSTCQSQESDRTPKTRNSFSRVKAAVNACETPAAFSRKTRRSTHSGSSVSSVGSLHSQDVFVVHQIEKEEIEARKHRIDRLSLRKKKKRTLHRLCDVFGIEEASNPSLTQDLIHYELSQVPSNSREELNDSFKPASLENIDHVQTLNEEDAEAFDLPAVDLAKNDESALPTNQCMTEEEIYMYHLQSYIEDHMDGAYDNLEYCDDLEFLYDDPDEVEQTNSKHNLDKSETSVKCTEGEILSFDVIVTRRNNSWDFDDCSEITCTL